MVLFLPKIADFLKKKKKDGTSKVKRALVLKGIFSETAYVCVCVFYVPYFKFLAIYKKF